MHKIWDRIENWLQTNASNVLEGLEGSANSKDIIETEELTNVTLPEDIKQSYLIHNGQSDITSALIESWYLLSLKSVRKQWQIMKDLLDKGELTGKVNADNRVRSQWWESKWIPIASNGAGDLICIDLNPTHQGKYGQVIVFWHMLEERTVIADSFKDYLSLFANELESGKYIILNEEITRKLD